MCNMYLCKILIYHHTTMEFFKQILNSMMKELLKAVHTLTLTVTNYTDKQTLTSGSCQLDKSAMEQIC